MANLENWSPFHSTGDGVARYFNAYVKRKPVSREEGSRGAWAELFGLHVWTRLQFGPTIKPGIELGQNIKLCTNQFVPTVKKYAFPQSLQDNLVPKKCVLTVLFILILLVLLIYY